MSGEYVQMKNYPIMCIAETHREVAVAGKNKHRDILYVSSLQSLRGRWNTVVALYGRYYRRPDYTQISDYISSMHTAVVYLNSITKLDMLDMLYKNKEDLPNCWWFCSMCPLDINNTCCVSEIRDRHILSYIDENNLKEDFLEYLI